MFTKLSACVMAALLAIGSAAAQSRIKDLVSVKGVRGNQLVGYGLVTGLNNTGDRLNTVGFTEESITSMLDRIGVTFDDGNLLTQNVAAVIVTAELPPFARSGSRIDVNIASLGDARSLLGGTLVLTTLQGVDGETYAVAQGPVLTGGFSAQGAASTVTSGVPTVATLPGGARVEKELPFELDELPVVQFNLRNPDFTTARRIEESVNNALADTLAVALDPGTVEISIPDEFRRRGGVARLISEIENLQVNPDTVARIVIDERTGTIVIGDEVRVSRVAVSQGNITIRVTETPVVSQPGPFAQQGQTTVVPRTQIDVGEEEEGRFQIVEESVTLEDLVTGLNALGVGPRDIISILTAMKSLGALRAELVLQ